MGLRFRILGSSSQGNSALLRTGEATILIDAGFSARRLGQLLAEEGLTLDDLDAVLLTHEHGDHSKGLTGLARLPGLEVYANRETAGHLHRRHGRKLNWKTFETGRPFRYRDLEVDPIPVPHDACDPVAFTFTTGANDLFSPRTSLAWVTDLGYIPQIVRERVREVDMLVIEANHDVAMLDGDERRPWSLKQRIKSRHGHLSNDAAYELVGELGADGARWQQVYLGHLSRDCNDVARVRRRFADCAPVNGGNRPKFAIEVIDPEAGTPLAFSAGAAL